MDFQPPELLDTNFYCLSHPVSDILLQQPELTMQTFSSFLFTIWKVVVFFFPSKLSVLFRLLNLLLLKKKKIPGIIVLTPIGFVGCLSFCLDTDNLYHLSFYLINLASSLITLFFLKSCLLWQFSLFSLFYSILLFSVSLVPLDHFIHSALIFYCFTSPILELTLLFLQFLKVEYYFF